MVGLLGVVVSPFRPISRERGGDRTTTLRRRDVGAVSIVSFVGTATYQLLKFLKSIFDRLLVAQSILTKILKFDSLGRGRPRFGSLAESNQNTLKQLPRLTFSI